MTEQLTTRTLEFAGYDTHTGAIFRAVCPVCGKQVIIPQFGEMTCRCGRCWRLQLTATASAAYRVGPSEIKEG